ncbi:putative disease resistance RPP13-like protein 1 isoform X2 [Macadamia integrifolia]|uniref:putative disease resistance RPP13-like protein 1 isoform X2 n=1 Tax=Macadamia integrifolia TaxID=60698 RepID=UPI001C4EAB80|nr:putative disease resistance RPP13-like protein 1 isoform X2 [Macadamia integrifolia]
MHQSLCNAEESSTSIFHFCVTCGSRSPFAVAEEKQVSNPAVKNWLDDLQQVAYDAEDIMDEYEAEDQLSKLAVLETQTDTNQVLNRISTSFTSTVSAFNNSQDKASRIRDITERLEDLAKQMNVLHLRKRIGGKGKGNIVAYRPATSSMVDEFLVYGRESDKNKIVHELLLTEEGPVRRNVVGALPIVGMGGLGKTTLAQLVYNDERVVNHFELKAWVGVSEEFDLERITKSILESATKVPSNLKDLDPLQHKLRETLTGKRFLIVLDDVWNEKPNFWHMLKVPFKVGKQGSKIMVTTRSKLVSSIMRTVPDHDLEGLANEDCWSLFRQRAFAGRDPNAHQNLQEIGEGIVKKCKGLPLAAEALGELLHSKVNEHYWRYILKCEIWDLPEEKTNIMPTLRMSYAHLSANVKRCFAYCSIFQKGYQFRKEDLVLLWMAEGFVQSKGSARMEDIGCEYFDDLLFRSFFQQSSADGSQYVMHDLIHDLAVSVSGEICSRFGAKNNDQYCKISTSTRHLSLSTPVGEGINFEVLYSAKNLRTFLLHSGYMLAYNRQVSHVISKLRYLRVLCLHGFHKLVLPDSIGMLIHLRYLNFQHTCIEYFPASIVICRPEIYFLGGMPCGIGRLTSLQTLTHFVVGKKGAKLQDLKNLRHIEGELCILQLENIGSSNEAIGANLKEKKLLETLWLGWSPIRKLRDDERETLEFLEPHMGLKKLRIVCYSGGVLPRWTVALPNLVKLELVNCVRVEVVPPLGQLPSLKHLMMSGMNGIKHVGREFYGDGSVKGFPSLETLEFRSMAKWEEWFGGDGNEFPHLHKLEISSCHKWRGFSFRIPALNALDVRDSGSLTSLEDQRIQSLNCGSESEDMFPCLHELQIYFCPIREILSDMRHCPSLKRLTLFHCHDLESLQPQGLPPTLTYLKLKNCDILQYLPEEGLPPVLTHLEISNCPFLEESCEKENGQDWTKISHIPSIMINHEFVT